MARIVMPAVLVACAALPAAAAAKPSTVASWDNLFEAGTPTNEPNTTEVGLESTADGVLHMVWVHDRGNGQQALLHIATGSEGAQTNGVRENVDVIAVAQGPSQSFNPSVDLVSTPDGGLRVFFSGLFPGQPIDSILATATAPASGAPWSNPVPASATASGQRSPVYAASGIGAGVDNQGIVTSAWGDSSPDGGGYRVGLGTNGADSRFSDACCEIDPGVGSDSQTGETMVATNLIDSGIQVRSIDTGQTFTVPESVAAWRQQRTSITGRIGAPGVVVGYGTGTNMFDARPAIWQVGADKFKFLTKQTEAEHVGIAAAPEGRIWLFWERNGLINATRSNPEMTKFGAIVRKDPPGIKTVEGTVVYRLSGEGAFGRLRILSLAQTADPLGLGYWMTWILPGLTLKVDPDPVKQGKKLEVRALDAGDPVKGVEIRLGKSGGTSLDKAVTGADGKAKLSVPGNADPGKYRVKADYDGPVPGVTSYEDAEKHVKVKKG